jgi:rRNA biogenesis protein RRP5
VRALELVVSLPNQLLGHIPITSISTSYTARLEAAESDSEESNSDAEESDSESKSGRVGGVPGLDELFTEGMWVSAVVTKSHSSDSKAKLGSREGDENVRASRRIELSLEPEKVNEGIVKGDLKTGFVSPNPCF